MPSHYSYCRHHCSMCSVHILSMSAVQDTININACKAGFKQSAECRMQEQRVKINLEECWDRQLKTSVPFLVWVVSPKGAFTPSSHQILDWNKQNYIRGGILDECLWKIFECSLTARGVFRSVWNHMCPQGLNPFQPRLLTFSLSK